MDNTLILVESALYGSPNGVFDVTEIVKDIFDKQYFENPEIQMFTITPSVNLFKDPSYGTAKSFTIAYTCLKATNVYTLFRGVQDNTKLNITVLPINLLKVVRASYATQDVSIDLTEKLTTYLSDPSNPLTISIGSQAFFNNFTEGIDPHPWVVKCFSLILINNSNTEILVCGYDSQQITIPLS